MKIALDDSAREFIVDKGFDQKYGARPLRRAIQKYVEDPLAEEILRGSFKDKSSILAKHVDNSEELVFIEVTEEKSDIEKEKSGSGDS
jgi:ATP-dependent Clp protease ATP-binding subunit ClpC